MKKTLFTITLLLMLVMALCATASAATSPAPISVEIPVTANGTAVLELKAFEGTPDDYDGTIVIAEVGTFVFTYDEPGLYEYTVNQVIGDDVTLTYDETVFEVRIFVASDNDGELSPTIVTNIMGDTTKDQELNFSNRTRVTTCSIDPPITKVVKSDSGVVPVNSSFSFKMTPDSPDTPMPSSNLAAKRDRTTGAYTITVQGPGEYEFGEILYDLDDVDKTYVYTLSEVDNKETGYTYDTNSYTVIAHIYKDENFDLTVDQQVRRSDGTVVGEDGIVFTNIYSKPADGRNGGSGRISVQTGISDYAGIATVCIAGLLLVVITVYVIVVIKDKRKVRKENKS